MTPKTSIQSNDYISAPNYAKFKSKCSGLKKKEFDLFYCELIKDEALTEKDIDALEKIGSLGNTTPQEHRPSKVLNVENTDECGTVEELLDLLDEVVDKKYFSKNLQLHLK